MVDTLMVRRQEADQEQTTVLRMEGGLRIAEKVLAIAQRSGIIRFM